jgi:hypothetical protein
VYLEDISLKAAREMFGVVLVGEGEDLRVDVAGTAALRGLALFDRLGREPRPRPATKPLAVRQITEYLDLVERATARWLACSRCGEPIAPVRENYKLHCHRIDRPIQFANTLIGEPERFIDDAVHFRQFCCLACGALIENEVCRAQDPVLWDIELRDT